MDTELASNFLAPVAPERPIHTIDLGTKATEAEKFDFCVAVVPVRTIDPLRIT